jgi:hypothetical protein
MHHQDYELAEMCLQQLREGRSSGLTEQEVQEIANRMAVATDAVPGRGVVNSERQEAWLDACRLASEMAGTWADVDVLWNTAINSAAKWVKAAE